MDPLGPWDGYLVYVLIDPRDGLPFYVGLTSRPRMRWYAHNSDPSSSAYPRLRELRETGLKCRVRIVAESLMRAEATTLETEYIGLYRATVLNRPLPRVPFCRTDEETEMAAHAMHTAMYGKDLWNTGTMTEEARYHFRMGAAIAIDMADACRKGT